MNKENIALRTFINWGRVYAAIISERNTFVYTQGSVVYVGH